MIYIGDIDYCNKILLELPRNLTLDLNNRVHKVGRPNLEKFLKIDPSEAIRSDEIYTLLSGTYIL